MEFPSAVSRAPDHLDLFITGGDGCVYTSGWVAGGDWSGLNNNWRNIGGVFPAGAPVSAVSRAPDHLDLFITGGDGCVYTSSWTAGLAVGPLGGPPRPDWSGLHGWRNIGGVFPVGAPVSAVSWVPDHLDLFITGNDGCVYTSSWTASLPVGPPGGPPVLPGPAWQSWRNIGGAFPGGGAFPVGAPVSAVSWEDEIILFITGNDGCVYTSLWMAGGDWTGLHGWRNIGGVFPARAPVSSAVLNASLQLFITGSDGCVYSLSVFQDSELGWRWPDSPTPDNPWVNIGGVFPPGAPVSAVYSDPIRLNLFITGNDGCVYTSWAMEVVTWGSPGSPGGSSRGWRNIGGVFPAGAPVSAVSRAPDQLDLFITGNDGCVYTATAGPPMGPLGGPPQPDWSGLHGWRNIGGVFPQPAQRQG